MIKVLNKAAIGQLIKDCVVPKFDILMSHKVANHVLQDIIANVQSDVQVLI